MKKITGIIIKGLRARLTLVCYIVLSLGAGFLLLYANGLLARVLNDYLLVQNFDGFALRLIITIVLFALVFGLNMLGGYLRFDFQYSALSRLARHYIALLLRAKNSYFTNRSSAELFTKLFQSSEGVGFFVASVLSFVSYGIVFIFYGIIVFRLDIWAGIFSVIATPLYFLATVKAGNGLSDLTHERMVLDGEMSTVTQEAFENVGNVKAKGAYAFFAARSAAVLRKIKRTTVRLEMLDAYISNITVLVRIIAPLLIILAAMQFSPDFVGGAGNIMVLYINIPLFLGNFANIHEQYIEYKATKPFLSQLREFDDVELESEGGVEITAFESLRTDSVKVTFDGGRIISVPDFEVKKSEKVMFFGESGIGKSTIFNIIMGLITEYDGSIFINGINLREVSFASLRKVFGITFQNTKAITLDLRENILLGASITDDKLERLIRLTALESQHDTKGDAPLNNKVLSGGEKSRIGLSQTLVTDPEIMLIDEAFSNMDEALESKIIADLFHEYPNRAVICISHRNSSKIFFDRVVDFNVLV